jgi:hypothetical protein
LTIVTSNTPNAPLDPTLRAATLKNIKHKKNVEQHADHQFFAVVLETDGRMHQDVKKFVKAVGSEASEGCSQSLMRDIVLSLAVANQKANARIVNEKIRTIRKSTLTFIL